MWLASDQADFAEQIESLPPLPAVAQQILAVAESPDSSAEDVARVLRRDPVIAAKVLRVANSSFFGASGQITQLSRAVMRLGSTAIRNLALGLCVRDTLAQTGAAGPAHETLWHHSVVTASACGLLARHARLPSPEEAFVAGLLHDTGLLAMMMLQPAAFSELLRGNPSDWDYLAHERELFGLDHTQVGYELMTRWRIPDALRRAAHRHHAPAAELAARPDRLLAAVVAADILAHVVGVGLDRSIGEPARLDVAAHQLAVRARDLANIVSQLEQQAAETARSLGDAVATPLSFRHSAPLADVVWIGDFAAIRTTVGRAMLEQRGYRVAGAARLDPAEPLADDRLLIVDAEAADSRDSVDHALRLAAAGHHLVVVLHTPSPGDPPRSRDPRTGLCRLPILFTANDLMWVEEELRR